MVVFVIHSDWGYWGKGRTLEEALTNAKIIQSHNFVLTLLQVEEEDYEGVGCDNMGFIHFKGQELYRSEKTMNLEKFITSDYCREVTCNFFENGGMENFAYNIEDKYLRLESLKSS